MSEKTAKTITSFNGTKDGYPMWEFKMKVFLREIGCANVLRYPMWEFKIKAS
jgi:hypothetical protein